MAAETGFPGLNLVLAGNGDDRADGGTASARRLQAASIITGE